MATFTITSSTSVNSAGAAFSAGTAAADRLNVNAEAFLIGGIFGAQLENSGRWRVAVDGVIFGAVAGIQVLAGNAETSTITIGDEGQIGGTVGIHADSSTMIENAGALQAASAIQFSSGGTVINTGTITGSTFAVRDIAGVDQDDTVTNSGTMSGDIELANGKNSLTNKGNGTITGDITSGDGNDSLINKAKATITGALNLGDGDDTVTSKGTITGIVDLGDGDDTFKGGNNADVVVDDDGADNVKLGGGDDTYIAVGADSINSAQDAINGGKGVDLYDASGSGGGVFANLSKSTQDDAGLPFISIGPLDANSVFGTSVSNDTVKKFENIAGGSGSDVLFGSESDNVLQGNSGSDDLLGLGGDDQLEGGAGDDNLVGGAGRDILIGGANDDTFWFFDLSDSGTKAAKRDLITDFEDDGAGNELIDLSRIDAIAGGADDAFTFIGTNVVFGGNAGELRAYFSAAGQIVEGDVDGDAKADFSFEIADVAHSITLSGANNIDFVL